MMTKKKTSAKRLLRFSWTLPVLVILLYAFAEPNYQAKDKEPRGKEVAIEKGTSQKTVKMVGLVLDEAGEPLPGTSVVIKDGTTGRVTDINGKFELEVPEDASIVLSFVGKKTILHSFSGITSGDMKDGVHYNKYKMKDIVIVIDTEIPPPPPPNIKQEKLISPTSPPPPPAKGEKEIFYIVEEMPAFPGGSAALVRYVDDLSREYASKYKLNGIVNVSFTVNEKGKVTNVKFVEYANVVAIPAAEKIIRTMPDWKPGSQRGKPVPVKYLIAVDFR